MTIEETKKLIDKAFFNNALNSPNIKKQKEFYELLLSHIKTLIDSTDISTVLHGVVESYENEIILNNVFGITYMDSASIWVNAQNINVNTDISNMVVNGWAKLYFNAPTEPVVNNAKKIYGSDFQPNTNMYIMFQYDGVESNYYFAEINE